MKKIDFRYDLLPLKNKLFRLALRITLDSAEAEDVTQDTLIRVWQRREELGKVDSIEAYCMTICRNLALDRREKRDAQHLSLDENPIETADISPLPDERLERDERLRHVHRLFNQLPERLRTILQLRDIEGKSVRETAQILEITEENVKVTHHRARQLLRQQYQKIESHGL
ncbi:MAG: sigma-70 family RNA polymerase sigma factor [Bacteroidaceae bacterium]|nr:sigma-70 family RNA polymerase sigma factor [Bacteroidaceae bacterium]MBQ5826847.1 sigma-70 family RNA polymerase sigma factor [Bacteroidaceae bacterium]